MGFKLDLQRKSFAILSLQVSRDLKSIKGAKRGGCKRGGFPIWTCPGIFCPFEISGLSRFFRDFPDLLGDGPGIFLIRPFSLSRPIKGTYEEQSRKGPRHNLDLSRKKLETPRFSFSQEKYCCCGSIQNTKAISEPLTTLQIVLPEHPKVRTLVAQCSATPRKCRCYTPL